MIRVFVGCAPNGDDAESCAVLEYSIRRLASEPVEITWMALSADRKSPFYAPIWRTEEWVTPFSGLRWIVPELCHFRGRAIYTDSDVIFMADIAELWRQSIPTGKAVLTKYGDTRACVSLWDCAAAAADMIPGRTLREAPRAHRTMTLRLADRDMAAPFAGDWNCLDGEGYASLGDRRLKALHLTNIATQPGHAFANLRLQMHGRDHWYDGPRRPHPRRDVSALFDLMLSEAGAAGYSVGNYVPAGPLVAYAKRSLKNYAA